MGSVLPFEPSQVPRRQPVSAPMREIAQIVILPVVQRVRPKPVPPETRPAEQAAVPQPL